MKFVDLSSGIRTIVSNEENLLIQKIREHNNCIQKKSLNERERQVAKELCHKNVLTRTKNDGNIFYVADDSHNIWRI